MIRSSIAFLALMSLVAVSTQAAAPDSLPTKIHFTDLAVDKALSEALKRDGEARIEITLDLADKGATGPEGAEDVHPTIFDLAMMAGPGPMNLDRAGEFYVLRIAAKASVVRQILAMDEVLAVRLDEQPIAAAPSAEKASSCISSPTAVCIGVDVNQVSVKYGGVQAKWAAWVLDNATFYAYDPNNWEVLVKILNGCGINGHAWLFAAAAGTNSYSVNVIRGGWVDIGTWTAVNAPIVDTTLFQCQ